MGERWDGFVGDLRAALVGRESFLEEELGRLVSRSAAS